MVYHVNKQSSDVLPCTAAGTAKPRTVNLQVISLQGVFFAEEKTVAHQEPQLVQTKN